MRETYDDGANLLNNFSLTIRNDVFFAHIAYYL